MVAFKKIKAKTEKELHTIIEKNLDALEEGLRLLKYEFDSGKGILDFLCVDSGGRLAIIEVKLQEDEDILFQALRYYEAVNKQRHAITKMFSDKKINPDTYPRILLVAEKFSDDIRNISTLVKPTVELYSYVVLQTSNGEQGISYQPVSLPQIEETPPESSDVADHRNYITKDLLKPIFDKLIKDVKSIGEGIEEYARQGYVGFKYKGRQIGGITAKRTSFDIWAVDIDENSHVTNYDGIAIEDGSENYTEVLERIKKSFKNLGGKPR